MPLNLKIKSISGRTFEKRIETKISLPFQSKTRKLCAKKSSIIENGKIKSKWSKFRRRQSKPEKRNRFDRGNGRTTQMQMDYFSLHDLELWPRPPQHPHVTVLLVPFSAWDGILFSLGRPFVFFFSGDLVPSFLSRFTSTGLMYPTYVFRSVAMHLWGITYSFGFIPMESAAAHMCLQGTPCSL